MDLLARLSDPRDLNVRFCAGTVAVAKPYVLLSEHQRFVGREKDKDYVNKRPRVYLRPTRKMNSAHKGF